METQRKKRMLIWSLWGAMTLAAAAYLGFTLWLGEDKSVYLIGEATHGHYQIELACNACHGEAFAGMPALQKSCVRCHGEELKAVEDSHPKSKFTDPRNADLLAVLDARLCVTCHREHQQERTRAMGVTLPDDYCFRCHQDIGEDRPSHRELAFNTCASAGCHNFHDNSALYEDFLIKHLDEPDTVSQARVMERNYSEFLRETATQPVAALGLADQDAPAGVAFDLKVARDWARTAHAGAGVNCSDCHRPKGADGKTMAWRDKPAYSVCTRCHEGEVQGFTGGRHGMRLAQELPAMRPALARQPMKPDAHDRALGCASCHEAHGFNTRRAAVDACLGCHDDRHTLAYKDSPHFRAWQAEREGRAAPGTGVSCATCHLPREAHREQGRQRVRVQHNQNLNLRPNEKMIRGVCMSCHGLGFSIDALADEALIKNNFNGRPARAVESLEWAKRRMKSKPADETSRAASTNQHMATFQP